MRFISVIFISLAVILLLHDVTAEETVKKKHHKKAHHKKHKTTTTALPSSEGNLEVHQESYFDRKPDDVISRKGLLERLGSDVAEYKTDTKVSGAPLVEDQPALIREEGHPVDPCSAKRCGAGKECIVTEDEGPKCVCIQQCPQETDARRKVCTNYNETWASDCDVYQKRCQCEENLPSCGRPDYAHVHIEYYGECRQMPECLPTEMADFPRRMRDWLFTVMAEMADREELSPHYMAMQREAESNLTRRWTNAAVWKFCDLDGHPADRSVSRHELFPIRANFMALEHCIAPFLNKCDADDDHLITLKEWARCLELNEDEIEDQCEDVRNDDE